MSHALSLLEALETENSFGYTDTSDSIVALQGHAPAAAHWIIIAAQRLYEDSQEVNDKWQSYVSDAEWIADQQELDQETRDMYQQALAVMKSIRT